MAEPDTAVERAARAVAAYIELKGPKVLGRPRALATVALEAAADKNRTSPTHVTEKGAPTQGDSA